MDYLVNAVSEAGNSRKDNQDSVLIRLAKRSSQIFLIAAICDGMGGLFGGEIASTTVICALKKWFEQECARITKTTRIQNIGADCTDMLGQLNERLKEYERKKKVVMGTTVTCLLILDDAYAILHVGDSRIYRVNQQLTQLTTDHTVVAREVRAGRMTAEQASVSKDRSKLTQCFGASKNYQPEQLFGTVKDGDVFVVCSDGFRHCLEENEILRDFSAQSLPDEAAILDQCKKAVRCVMQRGEKDNISVAVVKANMGGKNA